MTQFWPEGIVIQVEVDEQGTLLALTWQGQTQHMVSIANRWRRDQGWWKKRIWREYFELTTEAGWFMIVYHDLVDDQWYLQRLYD